MEMPKPVTCWLGNGEHPLPRRYMVDRRVWIEVINAELSGGKRRKRKNGRPKQAIDRAALGATEKVNYNIVVNQRAHTRDEADEAIG
jgi:hypothetical protein